MRGKAGADDFGHYQPVRSGSASGSIPGPRSKLLRKARLVMNNALGGFGWGALVSLILTFFLFAKAWGFHDATAIETGIVKLDGRYFTITPIEQ